MPNLPPTPAATPESAPAGSSESKPVATPESRSGATSFYQQLPQWFIAIFSLAYVSGYLIEFTHFGSFGILDASGEIFKLKYIQTGVTFLLLCAIIGVYTILVLGLPRLNSSIREALQGGFYLPRWSIFAGAFNVLSIYLATLLTPLPRVETTAQAGGTLALVFILVLYSTTLAYVIEKQYARARSDIYKERDGIPVKARIGDLCRLWRASLCLKTATGIVFLIATVIVDAFVFNTKLAVISGLFFGGGWIFLIFAACMPLLLLRVIDRLKQVTNFRNENHVFSHTILQVAGITLSILLLFLVLTSYSYWVFPFIPSVKGGGDYENAPRVFATYKDDGLDALAGELNMGVPGVRRISGVILIYATTSSYYFAKPKAGNDPCDWRAGRSRPKIMELRRDQIGAQSFEVDYKKIAVTNCQ